ncbi:MAG: hypothetical protein V7696_20325 [Halioglobus sp.]
MSPIDALPTVAEIAITLGGFIGLIVAFRPVSADSWSDEESARVVFVLVVCSLILLCALLPFALSGLFPTESVIWGAPLVIFGTGNLFLIASMFRRIHTKRINIHFPLVSWPILSFWSLLAVALLLSGLGVLWPFSPGLLLLGMIWSLLIGAITLIALMAQSMSRSG